MSLTGLWVSSLSYKLLELGANGTLSDSLILKIAAKIFIQSKSINKKDYQTEKSFDKKYNKS